MSSRPGMTSEATPTGNAYAYGTRVVLPTTREIRRSTGKAPRSARPARPKAKGFGGAG